MKLADIEDLYRSYGPSVLRRARAILGNEEAARDAMQQVFIKAIDAAAGFRGDSSPMTWLYRMTTNYCLNIIRDSSRRRELLEQHGGIDVGASSSISAEERATLIKVLDAVDDELQQIAIYYYVDQMNQDEIAEIIGVSRRTVGNRLEAFRAAAQKIVGATGE